MRKRVLIVHGPGGPSSSVQEACLSGVFEASLLEGHHSLFQLAVEKRPALIIFDSECWKGEVEESLCRLTELKVTNVSRKFVLASWADLDDKVDALDAGADDFLIKPVSARELLARIEAVLRTHLHLSQEEQDEEEVYALGDLLLYRESLEVCTNGKRMKLSPVECHLLAYLMHQAGHVISRDELLENVWLHSSEIEERRVVDVYVFRLREKIEENPAQPRRLLTKHGRGYLLVDPESARATHSVGVRQLPSER
jgi:DNA-binding response OmpR family regulator